MKLAAVILLAAAPLSAQYKSVNPRVREMVAAVDPARIEAILRKLETFETRHINSADTKPGRGAAAARQWILDEFKSYSPRLRASFDIHKLKKDGRRVTAGVDLMNVVAVLPGKTVPEQQVLVSGHYDSMALARDRTDESTEVQAANPEMAAPGVSDDGSGTAVAMELARVMSKYEFDKTLVFIAFAGEEVGLIGSRLYSDRARQDGAKIEAVLNNDIVGNDLAGNGARDNTSVRLFSADPADSLSRQVARYIKDMAERYYPALRVEPVFRADRFGRGGDHSPFHDAGFGAVRFTTASENYANQHTATDTFANASVSYTTSVARVNAAAAASLALAPRAPEVTTKVESGPRKGQSVTLLGRGKSRYDAQLKWKYPNPESDLLGFAVVVRSTLAPFWEREIFAGNVYEYTLPGVSIDNLVFGVKAIDKDGNESLVAAYTLSPRTYPKVELRE